MEKTNNILPPTNTSQATLSIPATAGPSTTAGTLNNIQTRQMALGGCLPPDSEDRSYQFLQLPTPSSTVDSNDDIFTLHLGSPALPISIPFQAPTYTEGLPVLDTLTLYRYLNRLDHFTGQPLPPLLLQSQAKPVIGLFGPYGVVSIHLEMVERESVWTSTARNSRGWREGWFNRYDRDGKFRSNMQEQPPIGSGRTTGYN